MDNQKLVQFVQELVQRPSLSGEEGAAAERVRQEMTALGFDRVRVDAYGSVVGVIEGAQPGKTLLFDGHTDTVGVTSGIPWRHDPFSGRVEDGSVYGRGGADMKGALAAFIHAAASVDRHSLHGRIVVSASTMEEVLEGVALAAVMEVERPDFVVIGESTDLNLSRGGRGRAEVHLETIGRPSHSSAPHLGRNAVLDMLGVVQVVEQIELPVDAFIGPAILALTDIISDPYPGHSVIPSICRVTYDRRLLPGERAEDVMDAITAAVAARQALHDGGLQDVRLHATIGVGEYRTYTGELMRQEKFFPAWELPQDDAYVQAALFGLEAAGLQPQVSAYRFCTNAAYSAGVAGVSTVGFGPATEADAHMIDERLRIDDLLAAARGYAGIIEAVLAQR